MKENVNETKNLKRLFEEEKKNFVEASGLFFLWLFTFINCLPIMSLGGNAFAFPHGIDVMEGFK